MPSITVRNIPEQVHRRLRIRAAKNGRSMEAELRAVLALVTGLGREKPESKGESDLNANGSAPPAVSGDDLVLDENEMLLREGDTLQKVRAILKARAVDEAA